MKLYRISALIERDLRKFFRSPALMMVSMVFPMVQLVILGYAFGGNIRGVDLALVDKDHSSESRLVREHLNAVADGPQTFKVVEYGDLPDAMTDLKAGFVQDILYIPPHFSQDVLDGNEPRMALIEDNTDTLTQSGVLPRMQEIQSDLNGPILPPVMPGESPAANMASLISPQRLPGRIDIQTVEVYPYIEYIKYLLAGMIAISVFVVAMIGGGITFIDDKSRGLHEGYLVTPVHKSELVLGLVLSGAIKGLMAGASITIIGGLIAGIEHIWDPVRLLYLLLVIGSASLCMISFMFLLMVRVSDPMVPRAIFGILNTLLFFPSGAVYPTAGFPKWLSVISKVDPFTYVVHALKNLLLKNTGFEGIYSDVGILLGFSLVLIGASIALFKRQI